MIGLFLDLKTKPEGTLSSRPLVLVRHVSLTACSLHAPDYGNGQPLAHSHIYEHVLFASCKKVVSRGSVLRSWLISALCASSSARICPPHRKTTHARRGSRGQNSGRSKLPGWLDGAVIRLSEGSKRHHEPFRGRNRGVGTGRFTEWSSDRSANASSCSRSGNVRLMRLASHPRVKREQQERRLPTVAEHKNLRGWC